MVKINLLNISEENVIFNKEAGTKETEKASSDEKEFSLESVDELFQTSQKPKQNESKQPPPQQEKISTRQSAAVPPQAEATLDIGGEESFEHAGKKKIFLISAIVVIVILAALSAYYFLFMKKNTEMTAAADTTTKQGSTQVSPGKTVSGLNPEVLSVYSQNKARNSYSLSLASDLINTSQKDIRFALMILTPGQIQFSILADSRNGLSGYQSDLKQKYANMNIRLVNSESINVSGQSKILADFMLTPNAPKAPQVIEKYTEIKESEMQSSLNSIAKKHRLSLDYYKKGQQAKGAVLNQTKIYCNLKGNLSQIIAFLQEMTETYPAIEFSKVALNPSNLGALGKDQITARITLILNEARMS